MSLLSKRVIPSEVPPSKFSKIKRHETLAQNQYTEQELNFMCYKNPSLTDDYQSQPYKGWTICKAAEMGNRDLVAKIISHSRSEDILPGFFKMAADFAHRNGHFALAEELIKTYQTARPSKPMQVVQSALPVETTPKNKGLSICDAAKAGNEELIQNILSHTTPTEILPLYFKNAAQYARQNGHNELAEKLKCTYESSRRIGLSSC